MASIINASVPATGAGADYAVAWKGADDSDLPLDAAA